MPYRKGYIKSSYKKRKSYRYKKSYKKAKAKFKRTAVQKYQNKWNNEERYIKAKIRRSATIDNLGNIGCIIHPDLTPSNAGYITNDYKITPNSSSEFVDIMRSYKQYRVHGCKIKYIPPIPEMATSKQLNTNTVGLIKGCSIDTSYGDSDLVAKLMLEKVSWAYNFSRPLSIYINVKKWR